MIFCVHLHFAQNVFSVADVKILSSDNQGMTLQFIPQFMENEKIIVENETFEIPMFAGSIPAPETAGTADIRYRQLMIAVPGTEGNSVEVLSADYETVNNFSLAVIPQRTLIDNFGTEKLTYKKQYAARRNFYPEELAKIQNTGIMRGWMFANILITPFQYQSAAKTLKKYSRIVVRITYGKRTSNFSTDKNDEAAAAAFLNYETAKNWMAQKSFSKTNAFNSVLSTGNWYKLLVSEEGIYKIDANFLRGAGIEPSSLNAVTDIKIFGGDGRRIAEDLSTPRPNDLPQLAVKYVDNNSNGKFDNDDYILFYGQGVTGWNYDPVQKQFRHYTNPYINTNVYFLAINPQNVPVRFASKFTNSGISGAKVTSAQGRIFFDEEKVNFIQSGQNWVSSPLNAKDSRVLSNKLYGRIAGTPITYRYHLYARATAISTFSIEESGALLKAEYVYGKTQQDLNSAETTYANDLAGSVVAYPNLSDERSNLKIIYDANSNVATGWIDWVEIFYQHSLTAVNDMLQFTSPDTSGRITFSAAGFSTNTVLGFDVSSIHAMQELSLDLNQLSGSFSFQDTLSSGRIKKYWLGAPSAFKVPQLAGKITNSNLHGFTGAEFIIISPSEFKSEAMRLKNHKENLPGNNRLSTTVVDIDTLYNEFGAGMADPLAIRDFLRYAVNNWQIAPKYVLFFGDASYDYKSILKLDRSWIPTYETDDSNDKIFSYSYDDFLTYLNPANNRNVSIAHGRLCARSAAEAKFLVDRIIDYETRSPKSTWKNTITIVADDSWTPDSEEGAMHTRQAETLANFYTPQSFEIKKIYIGDYPTVFTASGRRKPDARLAILDQVNKKGTLILNYTGHGNPKVWAHESILSYDDVKTQLTNGDKLTFVVAATCDWGRFDEAGDESSAEEIMINENGGAIGVFSATRAVYSSDNAYTNYTFYGKLFSQNPSLRLGDAYLLTKNTVMNSGYGIANIQKYHLLGDPTLRLAVPQMTMVIDSVNGKSITVLDTLNALEKIMISASVRDANNNFNNSFNGTAIVTVYDSQKDKAIPELGGFTYKQNGAVIYKGENSVVNGTMEASFIIPKDISYENKNGRISVYFSNAASDGKGYTANVIVGGTTVTSIIDTEGPQIQIYFDNTNFRSGDLINSSATLLVEFHDRSGINSAGTGIGHRIEAWIDESAKSIDLTDFYKGKLNSYQEGTVEYPLENLSPGNHTIKVRAWDVYNNSSSAEAMFIVASSSGLTIENVYNFPNPVSSTTMFTFQQNQLSPIDVEIKIYTVAGRLIQTIERPAVLDRFVKIHWDRRDRDGNIVGNGIYFYKVIAKTLDGKYSSEALGKMAVAQ